LTNILYLNRSRYVISPWTNVQQLSESGRIQSSPDDYGSRELESIFKDMSGVNYYGHKQKWSQYLCSKSGNDVGGV